ncbi:MAG: hypothetical protein NTV51_13030 [Verrucomicrobia bacterium]|nr:hypothetical protein [Verrucomicrobiota bacterium]
MLLLVTPTRGYSRWLAETRDGIGQLVRDGLGVKWVIVCPAGERASIQATCPTADIVTEIGRGLYPAINTALQAMKDAVWDYFSYINDDDGVRPGFGFLVREARARKLEIAYGDVEFVDENSRSLGMVSVCRRPTDALALFGRRITPFTQQGTVIRRDCAELLNGFDTQLSHVADSHFWVRALLRGYRAEYVRGTVAFFRIRPGQLSKNLEVMDREEAIVAGLASSGCAGGANPVAATLRFRAGNLPRALGRMVRAKAVFSRGMLRR